MTTFDNGPAKGATLMLKRSPLYLRVVVDQQGKVDALDLLGDEPRPGETVHAYIRHGLPGTIHIQKRGGGGFYSMATYRLIPVQPSQETMRSNAAWGTWVEQAYEAAIIDTPSEQA